jgi:hypothetical protein
MRLSAADAGISEITAVRVPTGVTGGRVLTGRTAIDAPAISALS